VPLSAGMHNRSSRMFKPINSSIMANVMGRVFSQQPEFNKNKIQQIMCQGLGRDVIRVESKESVEIH